MSNSDVADTDRKVRLALDALQRLSADKQRKAAWGEVSIQMQWDHGILKVLEITDSTTIRYVSVEI